MKKFVVTTTAQAVWNTVVEAETPEEAQEMVLDGNYDPEYDIPDDYINEEVVSIKEIEDEN